MYKRRKTYIRFACYSIKLFFFFVSLFLSSRIISKETRTVRSNHCTTFERISFDFPRHFLYSFSFFLVFAKKKKIANSLYKTRLVVSEIRKHTREEGHVVLIQSFIKRKTKKKKKKNEKTKKKDESVSDCVTSTFAFS